MKIFCPSVVKAWGDMIVGPWCAEMLASLTSDRITLDGFYHDGAKVLNLRKWIDVPGVHRDLQLPVLEATRVFDKVVATHHRHSFKRTLYPRVDGNKLMFFDAHGFVFRCIVDDWYPTFAPTERLASEYMALGLPDDYFALHLNTHPPSYDGRHALTIDDYLKTNLDSIKKAADGRPIVCTGHPIPGSIDVSHVHGWLKIYVLFGSYEFWGSYSGFTSIASMYRRRIRSYVVNEAGPGVLNLGPPIISYTNYDVEDPGSLDALYYAAENLIDDSRGHAYLKRSEEIWRLWCQYENFEICDFPKPPASFKRKPVYYDIENCLVPLDAKYKRLNDGSVWSYMDNPDEMMSLQIQGFKQRAR